MHKHSYKCMSVSVCMLDECWIRSKCYASNGFKLCYYPGTFFSSKMSVLAELFSWLPLNHTVILTPTIQLKMEASADQVLWFQTSPSTQSEIPWTFQAPFWETNIIRITQTGAYLWKWSPNWVWLQSVKVQSIASWRSIVSALCSDIGAAEACMSWLWN